MVCSTDSFFPSSLAAQMNSYISGHCYHSTTVEPFFVAVLQCDAKQLTVDAQVGASNRLSRLSGTAAVQTGCQPSNSSEAARHHLTLKPISQLRFDYYTTTTKN